MTEVMADVPAEGEITIVPDTETENSEDSPTEENNGEETPSTEGEQDENTQPEDPDKDTPFHEHPRWKKREQEWDNRFNDQETRHQDDLKAIREEFSSKRDENNANTEPEDWFGGDQEAWNKYLKHEDAKIAKAEERAVKRAEESKKKEAEAVEKATAYMKTAISSIEGDTVLNPSGGKVDSNKLLKVVMDNDLVDSKGQWNYRAGWAMMQQTPAKPAKDGKTRKKIASATTSETTGETKPANYKTSKDFEQDKPW